MVSFYYFVTKACARRPGEAASAERRRRERRTAGRGGRRASRSDTLAVSQAFECMHILCQDDIKEHMMRTLKSSEDVNWRGSISSAQRAAVWRLCNMAARTSAGAERTPTCTNKRHKNINRFTAVRTRWQERTLLAPVFKHPFRK